MTDKQQRPVSAATFAHLGPNELDAALDLAVAMHRFTDELEQVYARRNAAILKAATKLALKDMTDVSGLSAERVRQITKDHPVRWKRHRPHGQ